MVCARQRQHYDPILRLRHHPLGVWPGKLVRYNGSAAYEIQGENASGASSGTAMSKMEQLANNLPSGSTWAWSGLSLQEKLASGQAMSLYALSILVVFLCWQHCMRAGRCPFR